MRPTISNKIIYIFSICFIVINALLITYEFYWLTLLPIAVLLIGLTFFQLDKVLLIIAFFTPLSINLGDTDFGLALSLPTEPLLAGVLFLFFLKIIYERKYDFAIIKHPISLAIIFSIFWNVLTSITSQLPVVSIKFIIARLWFIVPFYFFGVLFFKKYANIKRFLVFFLIPLCAVVLYTIVNHAAYGFNHESAHWVMDPFFNDHTSYGALLAMMFPLIIVLFKKQYSNTIKFLVLLATIILIAGIVLSYTRAAWLSLVVALGVFLIYYFKINFKFLFIFGAIFLTLILAFKSDILMKLERNRQDSSNNMAEHIQSISNINSDASNLERINRWQSAFRMFYERPFVGFGPGTYMFLYAPYQHSTEKTIISTNAGTLGNAHSEYIGPLAEQGVFGTLAYIVIIFFVYYRGSLLYYSISDKDNKKLILAVLLGFTTYVVHGFINNFLDTDKAAVPFWAFVAIITAMDIYHKKELAVQE